MTSAIRRSQTAPPCTSFVGTMFDKYSSILGKKNPSTQSFFVKKIMSPSSFLEAPFFKPLEKPQTTKKDFQFDKDKDFNNSFIRINSDGDILLEKSNSEISKKEIPKVDLPKSDFKTSSFSPRDLSVLKKGTKDNSSCFKKASLKNLCVKKKRSQILVIGSNIPDLDLELDTISLLKKTHIQVSYRDTKTGNIMLVRILCEDNTSTISESDISNLIFGEKFEVIKSWYAVNSYKARSSSLGQCHIKITYPANETEILIHRGKDSSYISYPSHEYTMYRRKQYLVDLQDSWARNIFTRASIENKNHIHTFNRIDDAIGITLGYSPGKTGQLLAIVDPTVSDPDCKTLTGLRDLDGGDIYFLEKVKFLINDYISSGKVKAISPHSNIYIDIPYPGSINILHFRISIYPLGNSRFSLNDVLSKLKTKSNYFQEAEIKITLNNCHHLQRFFKKCED